MKSKKRSQVFLLVISKLTLDTLELQIKSKKKVIGFVFINILFSLKTCGLNYKKKQ